MNKIICGIISIILILGMVACRDNNELEVENNEIIENVENGKEENEEVENNQEENNKENEYLDVVYNTPINFEDKLKTNWFIISEDGTSIITEEDKKVEIIGFKGELKSIEYIHPEEIVGEGTLALLNKNGEMFLAKGISLDKKIMVEKIDSNEAVRGIAATNTYRIKENSGRVILALTEKEELKYIDLEKISLENFSIEKEKKYGKIYLDIVDLENGWKKDSKEETLYFGEHREVFVNSLNEESGSYEINVDTESIEIKYDNGNNEIFKYIEATENKTAYLERTTENNEKIIYNKVKNADVEQNAEKILQEYAYNTLKISEEEFNKNIIDIGRDRKPELVESIEEYPGGMRIWGVDAQNNIIEIKTMENDVDKQLMDGNYMIYETKEKESNDTVYFLTEYFADGLCYENRYVYKLKKEENTILMKQLFNYGCDSEVEEKAREEIFQKNPTEEIDNLEKELMSAHVLKYSIGKDRVSEEKFNTYIADMKERYESVREIKGYTINEN